MLRAALAALAPVALRAVPAAVDALSPEARTERQQLRQDRKALQQGTLGMSGAERASVTGDALRAIRAGQRSSAAEVSRGLAAGGPQAGAGAQAAFAAQEKAVASATGEANRQVSQMSADQAATRKADILRRLADQRAKRVQTVTGIVSSPMGESQDDDFTSLTGIFGGK